MVVLITMAMFLAVPVAAAAPSRWDWPTSSHLVSRGFAPPSVQWGAGHRGVDLTGTAGEIVRAAGAGAVSFAGTIAGRGVVTVIHQGGLRSTYEPVIATVAVGTLVATGTPIGTLEAGHAGCPVAACLHWGLRRGEVYLDPLSLLHRRSIRLLPLRKSI